MSFFDVRRARLRPEYAGLYPAIVPGVWFSAKKLARVVGRDRKVRRSGAYGADRPLPEAHFEFRGGQRGRQYLTGEWTQRLTALI